MGNKKRAGGSSAQVVRQQSHHQNNLIKLLVLLISIAVAALMLRFAYQHFMRTAYPLKYSEYVTTYAKQYSFSPSLIYAVIHTESRFDPNAISSAKAMGLMQITEDTFEWAQKRSPEQDNLPLNELFKPDINIHYGVYVLSMLREQFEDTQTMLAAYNAGIGNVKRWLKDSAYSDDGITLKAIPFKETRKYVKKIPAAQKMYQELYNLQ